MANARLVQVGGKAGVARREIDAAGALVTPGFVDIHTHFDGQLTWDPYLTPYSGHGVTIIVAGNCGVGFAPAKPDKQAWLIDLMEGVEDIPGSALAEGIQWEWESFPECLDVIARRQYTMDIGTQVPHGPLRAYVMGERGTANEEATTDDIGQMEGAHAQGLNIYGRMAGGPAGMLYSWQSTIHPFVAYPSYAAIAALPLAEKRVHLRTLRSAPNCWPNNPAIWGHKATLLPAVFTNCLYWVIRQNTNPMRQLPLPRWHCSEVVRPLNWLMT